MDAASGNALSRLKADVAELITLVRVLSASPFLSDSDDRNEADGAVGLFKAALRELPQPDSLYVGYDNGCWLQVRRLDVLDERERELLGVALAAVALIAAVLAAAVGWLKSSMATLELATLLTALALGVANHRRRGAV